MMRVSRRYFLASMVMLLAACVNSHGAPEPVEEPATIKVDNQSVLDMTIYAIRSGQRIRLGLATGLRVTTLTIPASLIFGPTPLRFLADPIGSNRTPVSEEVTVSAGDVVGLTIPAQD